MANNEISQLNELEQKIISILDTTKQLVDEFGTPGSVTDERKQKSEMLVKSYLSTDIREELIKKTELIQPYYQIQCSNYSSVEDKELQEQRDKVETKSLQLNF